jgi:hypothetical protein
MFVPLSLCKQSSCDGPKQEFLPNVEKHGTENYPSSVDGQKHRRIWRTCLFIYFANVLQKTHESHVKCRARFESTNQRKFNETLETHLW